jgi:hypothetical protein
VNDLGHSPAKAASVPNQPGLNSRIAVGIFAIFWCILVGFFDHFIFSTIFRQLESTRFAQAPAEIISSELKRNNSRDGDTFGVKVQFRYTVDGREYSSDKYSFDNLSSSDSGWARQAVAKYFAGAQTTCYYDPADPSRAILKPGIDGSNIFLLMFITPFNVVGLGLIWYALIGDRPARRVLYLEDRIKNAEIFTLNQWSPLGTLVATFTAGSFLGMFLVAIPSGFHPSLMKVGVVWGSILVFAIAMAIWTYRQRRSGKYDLILDKHARTLTIPAMHRRPFPETIRFNEVEDFTAGSKKTGSGDDEKTVYEVFLQKTDGSKLLLKQDYTAASANSLAETLRERMLI